MARLSCKPTELDNEKPKVRKQNHRQLQWVLDRIVSKDLKIRVQEFSDEELVNAVSSIERLEEINWVHFEGRIPEVLKLAIPKIRQLIPHATISIEFEKPDRQGLWELMAFADVGFVSHTFFKRWQSEHPSLEPPLEYFYKACRELNDRASILIALGADGASFYDSRKGSGRVTTRRVDLVDATGARDTFIAGIIWGVGKLKHSLKESTELAVSLATRKVAQEGFHGVWESK